MLLGKRPRPSMRRTTSMSGFSVDLNTTTTGENPNPSPTELDVNGNSPNKDRLKQVCVGVGVGVGVGVVHPHEGGGGGGGLIRRNTIGGDQDGFDQRMLTSYSPRNHRRSSGDYGEKEMASFLTICGLCKRRLAPGRDIFMYRGDTAFCSQECRQQQMNHDDKKEKCSTWVSKKESSPATTATAATTATTMPMATESTSNGETAVAA